MRIRKWCKEHQCWHSAHAYILCLMSDIPWIGNMERAQEEYEIYIENSKEELAGR